MRPGVSRPEPGHRIAASAQTCAGALSYPQCFARDAVEQHLDFTQRSL
jgi:hypothetical protein